MAVSINARAMKPRGVLEADLRKADYAELRLYAGASDTLFVTGSGIAGTFTRDDADTTSADNGGTIIVATNGKRWKRAFSGAASIDWFGADRLGVSDSATAVQSALTAHNDVLIPPNKYLCSQFTLKAGNRLIGCGWNSILSQNGASPMLYANSGAAGATLDNIQIENLQLLGQVGTLGFSEHVHLVSLHGVRNLTVRNVLCKGFRGDGLYIGSGIVAGDERHNYEVRIIDCNFDGVNNDNRNAISVIDVDGLLIEGCSFTNCTRPNMPGAIDLEPNANAFHIIRNVRIVNNKFKGTGGNVGVVAVAYPATVSASPKNIHVLGNSSEGYAGTGAFFTFASNRAPTSTSEENDLQVVGNFCFGGAMPLQILDGKRVVLERNTFIDHTDASIIGTTTTRKVRDLVMAHEKYIRVGSAASAGVSIFQLDHADIHHNYLDDCGAGTAGNSNGFHFNNGASSHVRMEGNKVVSTTGKTTIAVQKEVGHTFTAATNRFTGNEIGTLTNAFEAHYSDVIETAYTPVIAGTSAAGAGVYTRQYGRFRRMGDTVYFEAQVDVDAGHTGTGQIQVSLPLTARNAAGGALKTVALLIDGVATTGGQCGAMNSAAVVNGVTGAIRCFHTAAGVLAQTTIPAGAFKVYVSGTYEAS